MTPITGITPITTGTHVCANPFYLTPNDDCLLTFTVDGSQIPASGVHGGAVVCKTLTSGNNSPDILLCSQPSEGDALNINVGAAELAVISVTPTHLGLQTSGSAQSMIVFNHSYTVTATNISGAIAGTALNGKVTENATDCASVAPRGECTLTFTPGGSAVTSTNFNINGSNTTTIEASIEISNIAIQVIGSPTLNLVVDGNPGSITLKNLSGSTAALTIRGTRTAALISAGVAEDATNCTSVASMETCLLNYTPSSTSVPLPQTVPTQGTNTTSVNTFISVAALTRAYIVNSGMGTVSVCVVNQTDGTFTSCATAGSGFLTPTGIAINSTGTRAYIANTTTTGSQQSSVTTCAINVLDGTFTNGTCTTAGTFFFQPRAIVLNATDSVAYVTNFTGNATSSCPINADGTFGTCSVIIGFVEPVGFSLSASDNFLAYVVNFGGNVISSCNIDHSTHALIYPCSLTGPTTLTEMTGMTLNSTATFAYINSWATNSTYVCPVTPNGVINTSCSVASASFSFPYFIALDSTNSYAYITNFGIYGTGTTVSVCQVNPTTGVFNSCTTQAGFNAPIGIALVNL